MKYLLAFLFISTYSLNAQIAVDGIYSDWTPMDFSLDDASDNNDLDIVKVWVSNDDDYLYIRIDTDRAFDLQDDEDISIYVDVDNDPMTGFAANGVGSEITYYFGNRRGFLNYPNQSYSTNHAGLGLISLPTVTATSFEISLERRPSSNLGTITMGNTISISIENGSTGDKVPNTSGGFEYTMQSKPSFEASYDLMKQSENHTRVMTYNILRDGFEEDSQKEHLEDVIKAMNPDIIAFQEVYDTPTSLIADFLNAELPSQSGRNWQSAKVTPDVVVFTRGYMEATYKIDGNGVFLMYDDTGQNPIILYNVHLPCCNNDTGRQEEIDHILSVLRDKQTGFVYQDGSPIIITGDFNMVGQSQNLTSFIEGDIVDESNYGSDFKPDWDGSNLEDANPYVTGYPSNYTWTSDNSNYNPGKLDFIFYSGSVMSQQNGFVLDSEFLSQEELDLLNLTVNSTKNASDHLPVVVDFIMGIVDNDMDGFASDVDCDDENPNVNPSVVEVAYNGIDDDCDPMTLDDDLDMDGFINAEDCNDDDASINPSVVEVAYNGIDDDCDPMTLDDDLDMDGFINAEDCNDDDASINPSVVEVAYNGIDDDCDPMTLDDDLDMDGFINAEDCNDDDASINPSVVEVAYNGIDDDCDPMTLDDDLDMDGFINAEDCNDDDASINPSVVEVVYNGVDDDCDPMTLDDDLDMDGYPIIADCNDEDSSINPGAFEVPYNGIDEDCNHETPDDDLDGDGFDLANDCDDDDASVNPAATEIPNNGIDEDCDGSDLVVSNQEVELLINKIFPNPVIDQMTIELRSKANYKVDVINSIGQVQFTKAIYDQILKIPTDEFQSGIYWVKVCQEDGRCSVQSILKQ